MIYSNIFITTFNELLFNPLLNLLVFLYELPFFDFGVAILALTLLTKVILWPLNSKAIISQKETQEKTQEMQKEMREIQQKFKDNKQKQSEEIMKLWREKKFNPFSSFVPMIIQIIILIALFQVLRTIVNPESELALYSFISEPEEINFHFLGVIDLAAKSSSQVGGIILAILTGITQYFSSKMIFTRKAKAKKKIQESNNKKDPKQEMQEKMQKMMQTQMTYFMPVFIAFITLSFPAALALYWFASTLVGYLQQKMIYKKTEAN